MRQHMGKIVLFGIAIAGGYSLLSKENTSGYTIPYITVTKQDIADIGGNAVEKVGNFAKNTLLAKTSDALESVSGEVDEFVGDAMISVKTQTLNFLKDSVDKKVESLAVDLGVDLNSNSPAQTTTVLNPIAFAIKLGTPAYFTIKNLEAGAVVYEISWKDGKIDKGQIGKSETKVVSHSWEVSGEYFIKFRITSEKGAREYDLLVTII